MASIIGNVKNEEYRAKGAFITGEGAIGVRQ